MQDIDNNWPPARLFSTHGINGSIEQENRVTSAFLSTIKAVPNLWGRILESVGINDFPKIKLDNIFTYYQPPLVTEQNEKVTPDGAVKISGRGDKVWSALIEVKTGRDEVSVEQINKYIKVAEKYGIDFVLTITNTLSPLRGVHFLSEGLYATEKVRLIHLSWAEIKAQAVIFSDHVGVEDREQKWIVSEFIHYLNHEKSGASKFAYMGQYWSDTLEKTSTKTLNGNDFGVKDVVFKLTQVAQYASSQLEEKLGVDVSVNIPREERKTVSKYLDRVTNDFVHNNCFKVEFQIPNVFSPLRLTVDFTSGKLVYSVTLPASDERSNKQKANWFYKQLLNINEEAASTRIKINTKYKGSEHDPYFRAKDIQDSNMLSVEGRETVSFKISVSYELGTRGNNGKNSFIHSFVSSLEEAYKYLLGGVFIPYSPPAPVVKKIIQEVAPDVVPATPLPPAVLSKLPPPPVFTGVPAIKRLNQT